MRVAVLSSASGGGAGIAAYRNYQAIKMYQSDNCSVDFIDVSLLDAVDPEVSPQISGSNHVYSNTHYTIDLASFSRKHVIKTLQQYDVLNIHWCSFLLSIRELLELAQSGIRLVFTLHDFYYMTGGCHYPAGCDQYKDECRLCPQVNIELMQKKDVQFAHLIKKEIFSLPNTFLTAPSEYIVNSAINAKIINKLRTKVVRNAYAPNDIGIDNKKPVKELGLLLIADSFYEERKNLKLAIDGLINFARSNRKQVVDRFVVHLVGRLDNEATQLLEPHGIKCIIHGHVSEHVDLVRIYKTIDFILTTSLDDNWPNILVEAGAYGVIPIVGPEHGCEEFILHSGVGHVFEKYNEYSLGNTLSNIKKDPESSKLILKHVRETHDPEQVSREYLAFFKQ